MAFGTCWLTPLMSQVTLAQIKTMGTARALREILGKPVERADLSIRAGLAGRAYSKHLNISARAPILIMHRASYGSVGECLEVATAGLDAEAYELVLSSLHAGQSDKSFHSLTDG